MKNALDFLATLRDNNTKEWFDLHRSEWKKVQADFNAFAEELIEGIASFDSSVQGLTIRDCTYRLHRDTRFSLNKTPYKTHMGVYIAPKGKKSGYAGYYFHLEPEGGDFIGSNSLSTGLYMSEPPILRSVRDEIFDNGDQILSSIKKSGGFVLNTESKLKRTPRGFPADSKFDELLKQKNLIITKSVPNSFMLSDNLLQNTLAEFKKTTPFLTIVNKAVQYGYEEMMGKDSL